MSFKKITDIAKIFALTVPKAKMVLVANGLLDEENLPTRLAFDNGFVESMSVESSRYSSEPVSFLVWDEDKVSTYFKQPTEFELFVSIKNKGEAEQKFCKLIVRAVECLGLSEANAGDQEFYATWSKETGVSKLTAVISQSCYFNDPHFIGGPMAFYQVQKKGDVHRMFEKAQVVIDELTVALSKKPKYKEEFIFFTNGMETIKAWMLKNSARK